jgi:DNA replication and repair protein RecF
MYIKQLDISGIRNLPSSRLLLSKGFNAFYGANGSGKTSLLEAIYVLGMGRSFRVANLQQVINFSLPNYTVAGIVVDESIANYDIFFRVGTKKAKDNAKAGFFKDEEKSSIGEIAKLLPLLLINSTSIEIVEGGPSCRRAFIDFGLFHVEHYFLDICRKFRKCLVQRNAELKADGSLEQKKKQLQAWDEIFFDASGVITSYRQEFVFEFAEIFNKLILCWDFCKHVYFHYKQGWMQGLSLREALRDSLMLDFMSGCTNRGPHRAELEIFVDGRPARNVLSRGQQKLFVCAMILAKAIFLQERAKIESIFLIDDLGSELDQKAFKLIISKIEEIGGQVFITGIEKQSLLDVINKRNLNGIDKLFHVEQFGNIVIDELA